MCMSPLHQLPQLRITSADSTCRYIFLPRSSAGWVLAVLGAVSPEMPTRSSSSQGPPLLPLSDMGAACDDEPGCTGFLTQGTLLNENRNIEWIVSHCQAARVKLGWHALLLSDS